MWANIQHTCTHTLTHTDRHQPHICLLECVCCFSLEAPVGPARRCTLHTDLSYLISLTQYGGTVYLHYHNPSCRDCKTTDIKSHRKRSDHIVFAVSGTVHLHVTISGRRLNIPIDIYYINRVCTIKNANKYPWNLKN